MRPTDASGSRTLPAFDILNRTAVPSRAALVAATLPMASAKFSPRWSRNALSRDARRLSLPHRAISGVRLCDDPSSVPISECVAADRFAGCGRRGRRRWTCRTDRNPTRPARACAFGGVIRDFSVDKTRGRHAQSPARPAPRRRHAPIVLTADAPCVNRTSNEGPYKTYIPLDSGLVYLLEAKWPSDKPAARRRGRGPPRDGLRSRPPRVSAISNPTGPDGTTGAPDRRSRAHSSMI